MSSKPPVVLQCERGKRVKDGKVIRPSACSQRASGLFRVTPKRGNAKLMYLCAQCAFDKVPNHVAIVLPPEGAPADTPPMYYRDIRSVELIQSFVTRSVHPTGEGAKHWVEGDSHPSPYRGAAPLTRVVSRNSTEPMDMARYFKSLREHDDGK